MATIHPTAIVDPQATLATDVTVGAYSIIERHVVVESGCSIGSHVVLQGHTTLGSGTVIYQFASLGAQPQDLKFKGEPSTLVIGKKNVIREFVTLQPGTAGGRMSTVIGDNNLFMANSHVAHDCRVGNNNIFANSVALAGHVTIEDNVILGGMAGIHQFCRAGAYTMISAGSMVAQDIPPYCMVQGDRACLKGINAVGLERAGFSRDDIAAIRQVYRLLFTTRGGLRRKLENIPEDLRSKHCIKRMLDFLAESSRGIISPGRSVD